MSLSAINRHLIIYRGVHCRRGNKLQALKYGLHLSPIQHDSKSSAEKRGSKRVIRGQGKKTLSMRSRYEFKRNQDLLVQDIRKISGMRRFKLNFTIDFDLSFYKSESSIDSQYTVRSNDQEESEDELDLEIQSGSKIVQKNKKTLKKIFKQAKRVAHLTLTFEKMDPNHDQAFHFLPLLNLLEDCYIKIKIRAPTDILALRDLLNQAKRRHYWPNIKSFMISLRHSYNKENCSSKFIRFCETLQEISEIIRDLPWIKIQLKVKYMQRFDESAILVFQETLMKAQDQLTKLSLVIDHPKKLTPLFKTIEGMKNLDKFSFRFNEMENVKSLERLTDSLKRIQSLRRLKIQGKNILDKGENKETSTEGFINSLSDFSQITSFNFQERNQFIDKTLWSCFTNLISKLPQLQVLVLKTDTKKVLGVSPDLDGFLDFFVAVKSFHNLRIFTFNMYHCYHEGSRIGGSRIFQAALEALQNQKELRKLDFYYPWVSNPNSDIQELSKVLPNLQKLECFSLRFAVQKFIEPVENDTFMNFAKAISSLKVIQSFSINLEMKEVNDLTYKAAVIPFKHIQARKAYWRLSLGAIQTDQEASRKVSQLEGIYVRKIFTFA